MKGFAGLVCYCAGAFNFVAFPSAWNGEVFSQAVASGPEGLEALRSLCRTLNGPGDGTETSSPVGPAGIPSRLDDRIANEAHLARPDPGGAPYPNPLLLLHAPRALGQTVDGPALKIQGAPWFGFPQHVSCAHAFTHASRCVGYAFPSLLGLVISILAAGCAVKAPGPLAGAFDLHVHTAPDGPARSVNDIEAVREAKAAGMAGMVIKNHFTITSDRAALAMFLEPDMEVFGGVVLNRSMGGINPEAVAKMVAVGAGRGRIVWLPTWDSSHQVHRDEEHGKSHRPSVSVLDANGQPVPGLLEVFKIIADNDLILATGHTAPDQSLVMLDLAIAQGVKRLIVTHGLGYPVTARRELLKQMVAKGAMVELSMLSTLPRHGETELDPGQPDAKVFVDTVRYLGAANVILSTDLGQAHNPTPVKGLTAFVADLKAAGATQAELDAILRINPARILGLRD